MQENKITLYDFSKQIKEYRKREEYREALQYFKDNKNSFTSEEIGANAYIVADILTCLRKSNQVDAGFKFLEQYCISISSQNKLMLINSYGWLLYDKFKLDNNISKEQEQVINEENDFYEPDSEYEPAEYTKNDLINKIKELFNIILPHNDDYSKNVVSKLFIIVLKNEKNKLNPNWKFINDFCDSLEVNQLSKVCAEYEQEVKGKKQKKEHASEFEKWYSNKSKALQKLGKWEDCKFVSEEALNKIDKFHYNNDIWFSLRIALSMKNQKNIEEAIPLFQKLLRKKPDWYIQKELAELYFQKDKLDDALDLCMKAINNFGKIEYKIDLLVLIGKIYKKQGDKELANKHFILSKLIREEEQWKTSNELADELKNISSDNTDYKSLITGLKRNWGKLRQQPVINNSNEVMEGRITKILNNNAKGIDGFIGKHYFSIPSSSPLCTKIKVGVSFKFTINKTKDGKDIAYLKN